MRVHKPIDAMLLLGYQSRGGQPSLTVTVGYCCGPDGALVSEQDTWSWLMPLFAKEPFDLSQKKTRGGYGVAGDACAPEGAQVKGLTVRAGVGGLEKSVLVQGDRLWTRGITGWQPSAPQPFARMPIGLERAYGGNGWPQNPHGRGHCANADQAEGVALPNVERPDTPVLRPGDTPRSAILGVQPQGSPDLTRWLGAFDARWKRERMPWLPDDTDPRWFDRFEQDQCRQGYWRGDEAWFAENMHPRHAVLRGALPGLRPRLLIRGDASPDKRSELPLDLDTVWLFPNDQRVLVLYRTETAVRREDAEDVLGVAVFTEKMADAPQPLEFLARRWQEDDDARLNPVPPPAPEPTAEMQARKAAIEQAMADAAKAAQEHRANVEKTIADARKQAMAEADQHSRDFGFGPLEAKLAKAKADPEGFAPAPPPPEWPKEPAAFKAAVQQYVAAALAAGEAEARANWNKYGVNDFDEALARAKAQPQVEPDPATLIASLNLAPEKKQALLKQYQEFQAKIDAVQAQAAEISKKAEELRNQKPPEIPIPEEGLPRGPRTALDREALLARHAAGASAAWSELNGLDLSRVDLHGLKLRNSILRKCVLRGADLHEVDFTGCQLEDCDLGEAKLAKARFEGARLTGCQAIKAAMPGADFTLARLQKTVFTQADLSASIWTQAQGRECDFEKAGLRKAQGREANFKSCRFAAVDAAESHFQKTYFDECMLEGATLDGATLDGATLIACQAGGARFDGAHMPGLRTLKGTSLRDANFNRAQLDRAVLQDTDLGHATLRETHMDRGFLKNCDLSGTDAWHLVARTCDFTGSRIVQASWRGANLMQARLRQVVLQDVDLTGANLHAADTRTATAQGVKLEQALLTRCRLLEDYARE